MLIVVLVSFGLTGSILPHHITSSPLPFRRRPSSLLLLLPVSFPADPFASFRRCLVLPQSVLVLLVRRTETSAACSPGKRSREVWEKRLILDGEDGKTVVGKEAEKWAESRKGFGLDRAEQSRRRSKRPGSESLGLKWTTRKGAAGSASRV